VLHRIGDDSLLLRGNENASAVSKCAYGRGTICPSWTEVVTAISVFAFRGQILIFFEFTCRENILNRGASQPCLDRHLCVMRTYVAIATPFQTAQLSLHAISSSGGAAQP
jgi:hypothetical protein